LHSSKAAGLTAWTLYRLPVQMLSMNVGQKFFFNLCAGTLAAARGGHSIASPSGCRDRQLIVRQPAA